ncbi:ketoacyl-ACP synthase III [bacterium]|nr:ketoacyl-ACP synthase III [bacterium]
MLSILGMGAAHPDGEIDNAFIEGLDIGTNEQWILEKIGIRERKTSLPLEYIRETRNEDPRAARGVARCSTTALAVKAAEKALVRAGISASDIGLLICNSCTPEQVAPAEAVRIAAALGIEQKAYDVISACPAFALHMDYLSNFEEERLPDYVLCISAAVLTQNVNYNDRSDSAIWGDGAAAWIVSPRKSGKLRVLDTHFMADPTRCDAVVVDTFGHFHQDGRAVRDFSVRQTVRLIKRLEQNFELDWERDIFIGHQANRTMLAQITNNRKIPETNHWHNVTTIGNQAGAGAPAVLSEHWDEIAPQQKIAVAVVGAGLSWGSVLLEGVG